MGKFAIDPRQEHGLNVYCFNTTSTLFLILQYRCW